MANNGKIYWNFEHPVRAVAGVAVTQGLAVVLNTTLGGNTSVVPTYQLPPAAGIATDGIAITAQNTPGGYFDLTTEDNVYVPVVAGATFGVAAELAVDTSGKMHPATTGQAVVAKSVNAATAVDQIVTALRIAPYIK